MNRKFSKIYKIAVICSLLTGIALNIRGTASIQAILSYYTLQSNILALIAFVCFLFLEFKKPEYRSEDKTGYYMVKGAIVIAIFITALVYHITLAPGGFQMEALQYSVAKKQIANLFVHTISPILVIGDYFLFDEKGNFKYYYPVLWLVIPLNYVLYVYAYSNAGGEFYGIGGSKNYAYFFLDYEQIGFTGVAKWIVGIAIGILFLAFLLVVIDKKLSKRNRGE